MVTETRKVVLTGIKPTGTPHIANYFGAIKPAIEAAAKGGADSYFFIADYHALTTVKSAKELAKFTKEIACTWLACGLDIAKTVFYRQSDVPEIFELTTILNNVTPKGLMNRAHAYKAAAAANSDAGRDTDYDINMGLYSYPILMAADILAFGTDFVPVGSDQKQHVEIAADIAKAFNAIYGRTLKVPEAQINTDVATISGLDGQKMSKSYGNIIPLFASSSELKKCVMRIVTDSSLPTDPKPLDNVIFQLYRLVAAKITKFAKQFAQGIGWGDAKKQLADELEQFIAPMRAKYEHLMNNYHEVEKILSDGAVKARKVAAETLAQVRKSIGIQT